MKKKLVCLLGIMVLTLAGCGNKENGIGSDKDNGLSTNSESVETVTSGEETESQKEELYILRGTPEEVLSEENMKAYAAAMGGIPLFQECVIPVENTVDWEFQGIEEHDDFYGRYATFTAEFLPGVKGEYRYSVYATKDGNECEINEIAAGYIHNSYEDDITIDSASLCGEYTGKLDYLSMLESETDKDLGEITINITKAEMPESVFDYQIEGTVTVTSPDGTVYEQTIHGAVGYQCCCIYIDSDDNKFDYGKGETRLELTLIYDFENGVFKSDSDYGLVVSNLTLQ